MDFRVDKVAINNVQHVCFIDKDHSPITISQVINWANTYISKEKGHNTITSQTVEAKHLLVGLNYFTSHQIDLVKRVASEQFLTESEVSDFSRHCFKKASIIQQDNEPRCKVLSFSSKDLLSPAFKSATFQAQRVANGTAAARIKTMKNFIEYLHKRLHNTFTGKIQNYSRTIRSFTLEIKKAKTEKHKVIDVDKPIFDEEVIRAIFEITQERHPENPFRPRSQCRNRLILDTFFCTGMRKGALLQAKTLDLHDENIEFIAIVNRINIDDPRLHRPTQKTQSTTAPIEPQLMNNLKRYINVSRNTHPSAEEHDYIFISESGKTAGQPLSKTGVDYIFKTLSLAITHKLGRSVNVTPHMIRHYWNLDFSEKARDAGISKTETERLRRHIMAWSAKSTMPDVYDMFDRLRQVRNIKQGFQNDLFDEKENGFN
ncbi:site-specific integrase [Motilimonas sp. E26]|uniref:tyrosine-type recombinase/integrase n=1 Tax=Motilimonas sp. E26 TaxID=2865674 RepID=UPI001E5304B3|nr:site-specific integrase [Motilimonas sp. E26]MCE0558265.1 site-specific integrase [Motilimonas sp. E26]